MSIYITSHSFAPSPHPTTPNNNSNTDNDLTMESLWRKELGECEAQRKALRFAIQSAGQRLAQVYIFNLNVDWCISV